MQEKLENKIINKFPSFFQVLSQILKKTPTLLTAGVGTSKEINLTQLFKCACGCLGLPENGPVKYACTFLAQSCRYELSQESTGIFDRPIFLETKAATSTLE